MQNLGDPPADLTVEQLAAATASTVDELRRWQQLGLLSPGDQLPRADIGRVRLMRFVEERGMGPAAIARACDTEGDVLAPYIEMLTRGPTGRGVPRSEVPALVGLDTATFERLWAAAGFADQAEADDEDLAALGLLRAALDAGLPEDALAQMVRVYADALGRVAEAETRLFHHYVHDHFRSAGLTGAELIRATDGVGQPLEKLVEPAVLYFHRKCYQRALLEDLLLHLAEATQPPSGVVGEQQATILFVDLSGFTPLTEAMGDAAAALLTERFSELVRQAASSHHGRIVKQIGDGFMLVFTLPAAAVTCGIDIEAATVAQPRFPAVRLGAHTGTVLYREGDYIGATVNLAARLAARADRHQFLVSQALRDHASHLAGIEIVPHGAHELKGLATALPVFQVRAAGKPPRRMVDPVCRMELDPDTVAARLTRDGRDLHFCSDRCLRLFVADPRRDD